MSEILIKNSRIKKIDIKDGKKVIGQAVFNPYDTGIYKKYTEMRIQLARDKQEYDKLLKEYELLPKETSEEDLLETKEYDKLNEQFQMENKLIHGLDNIFENIKKGIDSIFGTGVCDLLTQGYQDEAMLEPLLDAAKPFFEEAARERNKQIGDAKLNREQRRSKK